MRTILIPFLCSAWLDVASTRIDDDAVKWLRDQIKEASSSPIRLENECKECSFRPPADPKLFICMSFSVPDETWLSLSKELEKQQGTFVIRGLPQNSFKKLAQKIRCLKEKGMTAAIQVDPLFFGKYEVTEVPTFVYGNQKLSGNVSLDFFLSRLESS